MDQNNDPFCEIHPNEKLVWTNGVEDKTLRHCDRCLLEHFDFPPEQLDEFYRKHGGRD